eukprot:NODE_483_length_7824_cov_0.163625.p5 type:complete len:172 gc:universal NODE_483_length_7824_cov_0.163625:1101-1616(+)
MENELLINESPLICWCCWESEFTDENPLIRACKSCKDRDLQYIHRNCIEGFLNNLPSKETTEFRCSRCLDPYKVEVSWSTFKTIRETPLIILPIAVISSFLITSICFVFAMTSTTVVDSSVTSFLHITASLRTWALAVFLLQTALTAIFLFLLHSTLPKSAIVKMKMDDYS